MALEKGQFIHISYTGKLTEENAIFDTTDQAVAQQISPGKTVKPVTICLGQGQLLKGLDAALIGKEGTEFTINLTPDQAFGNKDTKLLELVPEAQLAKQKIQPRPGMELTIDNRYGKVKSVASGRVVVDFNHPLAGKAITYEVKVLKEITDKQAQIQSLLDMAKLPYTAVTITNENAVITTPQLYPQPLMDALQKLIGDCVTINNITFEKK